MRQTLSAMPADRCDSPIRLKWVANSSRTTHPAGTMLHAAIPTILCVGVLNSQCCVSSAGLRITPISIEGVPPKNMDSGTPDSLCATTTRQGLESR